MTRPIAPRTRVLARLTPTPRPTYAIARALGYSCRRAGCILRWLRAEGLAERTPGGLWALRTEPQHRNPVTP